MYDKIFCPVCNKNKLAEVTVIEVGKDENRIEVRCPKCNALLTKIIGKEFPQLENKKV